MSTSGLNDQIISELDRFRGRQGSAYYAIQLNAPWGAGKTTFIKSYLDDITPQTKNGDEPRNLIITFFGSRDAADLDKQILAQLFSNKARKIGSVLSVAIGSVSGFFQVDKAVDKATDGMASVMLENRMEAVKGGLIVFDDIERSDFPLKDALGYMNRFVEDGFKVIVVSNDAAFASPDADVSGELANREKERAKLWRSFKEKLIGKTLRFTPEVSYVYGELCKSLRNERVRQIANTHATRVIDLIYASDRQNLRSVRMGLETFEQFVDTIDPALIAKEDGLVEIMCGCIYVALEIASGSKVNNLINPTKTKLSRLMSGMGGRIPREPTDDEKQMDDIATRYGGAFDYKSPPIPLQYIAEVVASGLFRKAEIEEALRISPAFAEPANVPPWRRLISIWTLDANALEAGTNDAKSLFDSLSITEPGELMHLASIMLWRQDHGDLALSGGMDPLDFIREYIQKLHDNGKRLSLDRDGSGIDGLSAHGFQVLTGPRPEMQEVVKILQAAMAKTAVENYPKFREMLMTELLDKKRNLRSILFERGELSRYLRMPIFEGADPEVMADAVFRDSSFDVELVQWLAERYQQGTQQGRLLSEEQWLCGLYLALIKRAEAAPKPLSEFWKKVIEAHVGNLLPPPKTEEDSDTDSVDDAEDIADPPVNS